MLILGIVNYNQLHFFGFKKQLIKNSSLIESRKCETRLTESDNKTEDGKET